MPSFFRIGNGHRFDLPLVSTDIDDKDHDFRGPHSQFCPTCLSRRLRAILPSSRSQHRRNAVCSRWTLMACTLLFLTLLGLVSIAHRFGTEGKQWLPLQLLTGAPPTLVFHRADLQRIFKWEVASGHYPSQRTPIPEALRLTVSPENPAIPPPIQSHFEPSAGRVQAHTTGAGFSRLYSDIQSKPPNVAYPPRPVPGSIADLDVVMHHCDFSENKYVRDCLEFLRAGAGLDNGNRLRHTSDKWKYIYVEQATDTSVAVTPIDTHEPQLDIISSSNHTYDDGLTKKRGALVERLPVLPPIISHRPFASLPTPCDPDYPRIFHMFWTGPFTDKPYATLLSFLYTQNLELHRTDKSVDLCPPQFWVWIDPGSTASPSMAEKMMAELRFNPWAAPFFHPRFEGIILFKIWNTTEQLDGVPELKNDWRSHHLFNSDGKHFSAPRSRASKTFRNISEGATPSDDEDMISQPVSQSSSSYDRLSVILSDLARFVLCHRFGGIYIDADTLFLRDWEELWGWHGAFAYRWSRLQRYNTAVLRLNKGSALGTFLFRTALQNNFDFHPATVQRYVDDAHLAGLLLRLPDALFDPAWLNVEKHQRDRPAEPSFRSFSDFFHTPPEQSAAPSALGIEGFFKGAYSYHYHNSWWTAFDPDRNWPDLGPRFIDGETSIRGAAAHDVPAEDEDPRDLAWSAVLKRSFEGYVRGERPNMYGEWLKW